MRSAIHDWVNYDKVTDMSHIELKEEQFPKKPNIQQGNLSSPIHNKYNDTNESYLSSELIDILPISKASAISSFKTSEPLRQKKFIERIKKVSTFLQMLS